MTIQELIAEIDAFLKQIHKEVDKWFDKEAELLHYRPENNAWTIAEILEHIVLTNKYLLILIEKGRNKALKNIQKRDLATELENYEFQKDRLDEVGFYKSFVWVRPEHMEPKGEQSLAEIQDKLETQVLNCRCYLGDLKMAKAFYTKQPCLSMT